MRVSVIILGLVVANLMSSGCTQRPPTQENTPTPTETRTIEPTLLKLHPDTTNSGQTFNRQSSGASGLAVTALNAKNTTAIVFGGQRLDTVFGGESLLSAEVPAALYAKPGRIEVLLQTGSQKSNVLIFEVR